VSKLASPVAKEAATGAGCAKPLDKRLLSDFGDPEDRLRLLAKAVHLQLQPAKAPLTEIEKMIYSCEFAFGGEWF
jgi:hypothetical protein